MRRRQALALAALLPLPRLARAQGGFPDRPLRLVIPFTAGGSNDIVGRMLAEAMAARLGQPVVVENRGGAGGPVGAASVARGPADGHLLMWGHVGTLAVNPWIYPNNPYDPLRDFAPVALVATLPGVLAVHPSVGVRTAEEFVALAKRQPGTLEYGSAGNGSASHITMAGFCDAAGIELVHVPYRGNGPMLTDLLAGRVKASFAGAPVVLPASRDNRLVALGISASRPSALMPGLDPVARAVPGYEMLQWHGLVAPAATPAEVVARLNTTINGFLRDAEMTQRLATEGAEPAPMTPAEFRELIARELERFRLLVARANIKPD